VPNAVNLQSARSYTLKSLHSSILLTEYMNRVEPTDTLSTAELQPVLLGLFGEVGSIMATAKKWL
jgi:hypothetical protein